MFGLLLLRSERLLNKVTVLQHLGLWLFIICLIHLFVMENVFMFIFVYSFILFSSVPQFFLYIPFIMLVLIMIFSFF